VPPVREGLGSPSPSAYRTTREDVLKHHYRMLQGAWTVIGIIVGAAAAGFVTHSYMADFAKQSALTAETKLREDQKADIDSIKITLMGIQKDVEWIKGSIQTVHSQQETLSPKKK